MVFGKKNESKLAPKWNEKSMSIAKGDLPKTKKNLRKKQCFLRFNGSRLGIKIDKKLIPKRGQLGKASWQRFFFDFDGFCEPSWKENRTKIEEKVHGKFDAKLEPFRMRLGAVLGRFWAPKKSSWPLRSYYGPLIFALNLSLFFDIVF